MKILIREEQEKMDWEELFYFIKQIAGTTLIFGAVFLSEYLIFG